MRVFVTTELFPFTHGGIGRSIANMLSVSSEQELASTAVVWVGDEFDAARFEMLYPKVRLIVASRETYRLVDDDGISYPPEWAFTATEWHWQSVRAMQGLLRLAAEKSLDYVEFHDWGGLAFASLQEKLLGRAFADTVLAVRLHTADSLLADVDSRPVDKRALAVYDLERKALADCDVIVAQLPEVARAMQAFFAFADDDWNARLVLHASPVVLDIGAVAARSIEPSSDTNIVFSSKIQHLKRPELFVRGCCGFLRANPDYRGSIVFAAHSSDENYQQRIERMVPADLRQRFQFLDKLNVTERHNAVSRSVCVFTSPFESFCLAAYEASMSGGICVVNATNPAFGEHSPWIDDVNSIKFDGGAPSLAAALGRAIKGGARDIVRVPQTAAPWTLAPKPRADAPAVDSMPLVSVVVPHFNLGHYLVRTIDSVLASTYANVELVVVDDCSTERFSQLAIERLEGIHERLRIVRNEMNLGLAATRNVALTHVRGDYVLTLDADDLISPGFIELAVGALTARPGYDFVIPQTGFFLDADEGQIGRQVAFTDYAVFFGEAAAIGMYENRFSTATCLARTRVLRELGYREELEAYEDWDMYMRATAAGKRFVVTNGIHFFYRRRQESMYHTPERLARHRSLYHDLIRKKTWRTGVLRMPLYVVEAGTSRGAEAEALMERVEAMQARLNHFERSRAVFAVLKLQSWAQRNAPWVARLARKGARVARGMLRRLRSRG
ncbi:glycosyl transferase family 2 [Caballeronia cordobensis]|uniref:Glycosyl transferase family 2 n=1 Tax=Caballeronia cordobensis TaxID=1353886 RepID=A0A158JKG5_CABCO|nr:glycosyltransferase [Caballeronia cordobensis]SAL69354.1 glycosyl transferase family 2 [Caballeronia cordobensis]